MTLKEFLSEKLKELFGITTKEQEALLAEHARLTAEQAQLKADAEIAKKALREAEVKSLLTALGHEYDEETAKPYFEYSDEQFAFISADLLPHKSQKYPAKSVMIH
jgi:hypothetical protein